MVSPARTNRSEAPLGAVAPSSPSRGPSHWTRHPGGHDTAATTSAQVVGFDAVGTGAGGVVAPVVARVVDVATTDRWAVVGGITRCRRTGGSQRGGRLVLVVVPAGGAHDARLVHVDA